MGVNIFFSGHNDDKWAETGVKTYHRKKSMARWENNNKSHGKSTIFASMLVDYTYPLECLQFYPP